MVHKGGRGDKNFQISVHMVYECPLRQFYMEVVLSELAFTGVSDCDLSKNSKAIFFV